MTVTQGGAVSFLWSPTMFWLHSTSYPHTQVSDGPVWYTGGLNLLLTDRNLMPVQLYLALNKTIMAKEFTEEETGW